MGKIILLLLAVWLCWPWLKSLVQAWISTDGELSDPEAHDQALEGMVSVEEFVSTINDAAGVVKDFQEIAQSCTLRRIHYQEVYYAGPKGEVIRKRVPLVITRKG
jgi:hypothetical protein